ncbi:MAG TPA: transposase [Pseudonocardiaceae bacterium]|nr:transposase [Pseudonocardiaceae bacterium]
MDESGTSVLVTRAAPDAGGLASLVNRLGDLGQPVTAVIESMNGARFVHDQLELRGWDVQIADAVKVKGFAPLACKTDKIDAWVLAELSRRDLVPAIWLPDPAVRAERERARWRLHLVVPVVETSGVGDPGGGVVEVEAAGAVEGLFGGAGE